MNPRFESKSGWLGFFEWYQKASGYVGAAIALIGTCQILLDLGKGFDVPKAVLVALLIPLIILIFKSIASIDDRVPSVPREITRYLWGIFAYNLFVVFLFSPRGIGPDFENANITDSLIISGINTVLWVAYFSQSKRVKQFYRSDKEPG